MHTVASILNFSCLYAALYYFCGDNKVDPFLLVSHFQVLSRLSELETTLEAGLRHRDAALTSIGFQLTKWMNMVQYFCLIFLLFKLITTAG